MLPLDVLLIRGCLAAIVGLVAGSVVSARWAVLVGVVVLYVLLVVARKPVQKWPPA